MCGICGIIGNTKGYNREQVLSNMMQKIYHRGPDDAKQYIDEKAALGFQRLSIIDLDHGAQPMQNENKDVTIVFNGEIYNFPKLREELINLGHTFANQADTEVLVHGYEEYGVKLLNKLRGMFAFGIWDQKEDVFFAARDFFGIKPFYYAVVEDTLVFASEIKSILEYPLYQRAVNEEALEQYLSFQYSVLPETFFKGIYKLEPGYYLLWKDKKLTVKQYYNPMFTPDENASEEALESEIKTALKDSMEAHKISDVEVGSFLSSGVDSSYVAKGLGECKTFTVGFLDEKSRFNEISFARNLSKLIGVENYSKVISTEEYWDIVPSVMYYMDEPLGDAASVALYFVNQEARKHLKVAWSGEGADEFFGGYNIYHETWDLRGWKRVPKFIKKPLGALASHMPNIKGKSFIIRGCKPIEETFIGNANVYSKKDREAILKHPVGAPSAYDYVKKFYKEAEALDDLGKMQYIDLKCWLPGDILLKADKMSMANSVEVRVPFLDRKVFNVAKKVPPKYKVTKNATKYIFRKVAYKELPKQTAEKKKLGFPIPMALWLKEDKYYNEVKRMFSSEAAGKYFHRTKLLQMLEEHKSGKKDNYRRIWLIYVFLVWYNVYFEEGGIDSKHSGLKELKAL